MYGDMKCAYMILVGILEGKRPCGRPRLGLDCSGWRYGQMNTVMNFQGIS